MGHDSAIREAVKGIPVPDFDYVPHTVAKPLSEARVAIVTTAGLRLGNEGELWKMTDSSFTVLPSTERNVHLSHFSPNFDRSGFAADINTVYPIDRLDEMVAAGEIGSVSEHHISFMGAQADATFATMLLDTGPAAAKVLADDAVDIIVLTPV